MARKLSKDKSDKAEKAEKSSTFGKMKSYMAETLSSASKGVDRAPGRQKRKESSLADMSEDEEDHGHYSCSGGTQSGSYTYETSGLPTTSSASTRLGSDAGVTASGSSQYLLTSTTSSLLAGSRSSTLGTVSTTVGTGADYTRSYGGSAASRTGLAGVHGSNRPSGSFVSPPTTRHSHSNISSSYPSAGSRPLPQPKTHGSDDLGTELRVRSLSSSSPPRDDYNPDKYTSATGRYDYDAEKLKNNAARRKLEVDLKQIEYEKAERERERQFKRREMERAAEKREREQREQREQREREQRERELERERKQREREREREQREREREREQREREREREQREREYKQKESDRTRERDMVTKAFQQREEEEALKRKDLDRDNRELERKETEKRKRELDSLKVEKSKRDFQEKERQRIEEEERNIEIAIEESKKSAEHEQQLQALWDSSTAPLKTSQTQTCHRSTSFDNLGFNNEEEEATTSQPRGSPRVSVRSRNSEVVDPGKSWAQVAANKSLTGAITKEVLSPEPEPPIDTEGAVAEIEAKYAQDEENRKRKAEQQAELTPHGNDPGAYLSDISADTHAFIDSLRAKYGFSNSPSGSVTSRASLGKEDPYTKEDVVVGGRALRRLSSAGRTTEINNSKPAQPLQVDRHNKIKLGSKVKVQRFMEKGVVRWLGIFEEGCIAGLEMDRPRAIYNDKYEEKSWFTGPENKVHYVDCEHLEVMEPETTTPKAYESTSNEPPSPESPPKTDSGNAEGNEPSVKGAFCAGAWALEQVEARLKDEASIFRNPHSPAVANNHPRINELEETTDGRIKVGMRVQLKYTSGRIGTVQWIGMDSAEQWVGIEMDESQYGYGTNSTLFGAKWFECPEGKAEYTLSSRVEPLPHEEHLEKINDASLPRRYSREDYLLRGHPAPPSYHTYPTGGHAHRASVFPGCNQTVLVVESLTEFDGYRKGQIVKYLGEKALGPIAGEIKFIGSLKTYKEGKVHFGLDMFDFAINREDIFENLNQFEPMNKRPGCAVFCEVTDIAPLEDVPTDLKPSSEPERRLSSERKGSDSRLGRQFINTETIAEEPSSEDTSPELSRDLYSASGSEKHNSVNQHTRTGNKRSSPNRPADIDLTLAKTASTGTDPLTNGDIRNSRNHQRETKDYGDNRGTRATRSSGRAPDPTHRSAETSQDARRRRDQFKSSGSQGRLKTELLHSNEARVEHGRELTRPDAKPLKDVSQVQRLKEWNGFEEAAMVQTSGQKKFYGVVRWMGYLPGWSEDDPPLVGIEIDEDSYPDRSNSGSSSSQRHGVYDGYQLFECQSGRGAFLSGNRLQRDSRFEDVETAEEVRAKYEMPESLIVAEDQLCRYDEEKFLGRFRGIQGHHNSCYLDSTLYSMFAFSQVFDSVLHRPVTGDDIPEYGQVQTILREKIVNPLRREHYVDAQKVMELRELLDKLTSVTGMMGEEKDPEEFLNSLLLETLKAEPFIKLSSGQASFLYQLFMEKQEHMKSPNVQNLIDISFRQSKVRLKQVPPCLILQMPRFGRVYKMFDRIVPSPTIDITDILEPSEGVCLACRTCRTSHSPSWFICDECSEELSQDGKPVEFCHKCWREHTRNKRYSEHRGLVIEGNKDRQLMELFSIVCIETSHYVSFTKTGPETGAPWVFFDSMADRIGDVHGFNIPEVSPCVDITDTHLLLHHSQEPLIRRVLQDAYLCFYRSASTEMYC